MLYSLNVMSAGSALHELGLDSRSIAALRRKARGAGKTTPQYVRMLIEAGLRADQTFDVILAPVREGFRKNGTSPEKLDELFGKARKKASTAARRSRKRRGGVR